MMHPLLIAAQTGNKTLLQEAIARGIMLREVSDPEGTTILHAAAQSGQREMIEWLVSNADTSLKHKFNKLLVRPIPETQKFRLQDTTDAGANVLHYAALGGHQNLITWLLTQGFSLHDTTTTGANVMHYAARGGHAPLIAWLQSQGLNRQTKDTNGAHLLHYAFRGGHQALIDLLQTQNFSLSDKDANGASVTHYAALGGQQKFITALCTNQQGFSLKDTDNHGANLLHYAGLGGHSEVILWLEKQGLSITSTNNIGQDILHYAARGGRQDLYQWLQKQYSLKADNVRIEDLLHSVEKIKKSTSYNWISYEQKEIDFDLLQKNPHHMNVLHSAAQSGQTKFILFLLRQGFSLNSTDDDDRDVFYYATQGNHVTLISYLLNQPIPKHDKNGATPLHYAALHGNQVLLSWLLTQGFSLQQKDKNGASVIHYAARGGHQPLITWLLTQGFTLQDTDNNAASVLLYAFYGGNQELIYFLLEHKCSLEYKDNEQASAIHYAALGGHIDLIDCLCGDSDLRSYGFPDELNFDKVHIKLHYKINRKFSLTEKDANGASILHYAARGGHYQFFKNFRYADGLESSSRPAGGKDQNGRLPLHYAAQGGQWKLVAFLAKISAKETTPRTRTGSHSIKYEHASHFLNDSIGLRDYNGWNIHHLAIIGQHQKLTECLLLQKLSLFAKNADGEGELHYVARYYGHNQTLIDFLIKEGGKLQDVTKTGATLLHYAAWGGNQALCIWLQAQGLSWEATDQNGASVLHYAAKGGHQHLITFLLAHVQGFTIHDKDKNGATLLHYAASCEIPRLDRNVRADFAKWNNFLNDLKQFITFLVTQGLSLQATDNNERNILHYAADCSAHDFIEWLHNKSQLSLETKDRNGISILHCALMNDPQRSHVIPNDMVKWLHRKGFFLEYKNQRGETELHHAARYGNQQLLEFLVTELTVLATKKLEITAKTTTGATIIHYAALGGHQTLIKELCENHFRYRSNDNYPYKSKFSLADVDDNGAGVLHYAAMGGHQSLICAANSSLPPLISTANLSLKDKNDATLLHYAAKGGQRQLLSFLVQKLAVSDLKNHKDKNNANLLHYAATGDFTIIPWLISQGVSLDDKTTAGNTALFLLFQETKNKAAFVWLTTQGVDVLHLITPPFAPLKKAFTNEERDTLEVNVKTFKNNELILSDISTALKQILQKSPNFATAYATLISNNNFTHEHRLQLLAYVSGIQPIIVNINKLDRTSFLAEPHRARYQALIESVQTLQTQCDTILQHPHIRNNWARVRIWHSGQYQEIIPGNPQFTADGSGAQFMWRTFWNNASPNQNQNVGHVSLETNFSYMSFWPDDHGKMGVSNPSSILARTQHYIEEATRGRPATMYSLLDDRKAEGADGHNRNLDPVNQRDKDADYEAIFFTLDVEKINAYCGHLAKRIPTQALQFSLLGAKKTQSYQAANSETQIMNCVILTYNLLLQGSIEHLTPARESTYPTNGILTPYYLQALTTVALSIENQRYAAIIPLRATAPKRLDAKAFCIEPKIKLNSYKVIAEFITPTNIVLRQDEIVELFTENHEGGEFMYDGQSTGILSLDVINRHLEQLPVENNHQLTPGKISYKKN